MLSNEAICTKIGWEKVKSKKLNGVPVKWVTPGGKILGTPHFNTIQPWRTHVFPFLLSNQCSIDISIRSLSTRVRIKKILIGSSEPEEYESIDKDMIEALNRVFKQVNL